MKSFKAWMTQCLFSLYDNPIDYQKQVEQVLKKVLLWLQISFALLNWLIFKLLYCYQKKICVIIVSTNTNNPAKTTCLMGDKIIRAKWYVNCGRWHFKPEKRIPMTLGQCHAELPHSLASLSSVSWHQTEALCRMPFPSLTQAGGSVFFMLNAFFDLFRVNINSGICKCQTKVILEL